MTTDPMLPPAPPLQESRTAQGKPPSRVKVIAGALGILLAGVAIGFVAAPTPAPVTHTKFITEPAPPMPESCQIAYREAEETFLEFEEFTSAVSDLVTGTDGKNYLMSADSDGVTAQRTLLRASIREYVEAKFLCQDETGLDLPIADGLG